MIINLTTPPYWLLVQVLDVLVGTNVRVTVDQGSLKAQFTHGFLQFVVCAFWVLEGHRRKGGRSEYFLTKECA